MMSPPRRESIIVGETPELKPRPWYSIVIATVFMALLFGTAFAKSHGKQNVFFLFCFSIISIMVYFLGAMSVSAFCLSLLGACSSTKFEIARTMWAGNDRGWLSGTALGAAILGVGMPRHGPFAGGLGCSEQRVHAVWRLRWRPNLRRPRTKACAAYVCQRYVLCVCTPGRKPPQQQRPLEVSHPCQWNLC